MNRARHTLRLRATRLLRPHLIILNHLLLDYGTALLEIRDSRLYRQQFPTFEAYCRERWRKERRWAYQLMEAVQAVENVRNCAQTVPQTESQARPLTALEPEVQREVWRRR